MIMETPLCKCNNCGNIWLDKNPQVNQKVFEVEDGCPSLALITESLDDNEDAEMYWGCPECRTDGHLSDFEGEVDVVGGKLVEKK